MRRFPCCSERALKKTESPLFLLAIARNEEEHEADGDRCCETPASADQEPRA